MKSIFVIFIMTCGPHDSCKIKGYDAHGEKTCAETVDFFDKKRHSPEGYVTSWCVETDAVPFAVWTGTRQQGNQLLRSVAEAAK